MDRDYVIPPSIGAMMNYPDGGKVMIHDRLNLWPGCAGTVVAAIDDDQFSPGYRREDWGYLETGVLIESDKAGLMHYIAPQPTFALIARHPPRRRRLDQAS